MSTRRDLDPDAEPIPELEITWLRSLSVCWSATWRTMVIGLGIGLLAAPLIAIVGGITGLDLLAAGPILGGLAAMVVAGLVIHAVLRKRYSEFSIRVFPEDDKVQWRHSIP